jgi:hypothetical protein
MGRDKLVPSPETAGSLPFLQRNPQERRQNPNAGDKRSAQSPGHFRYTSSPAAVIDRDFQNAQPLFGRAHLHLQVPTVGLFAHSKTFQRLAANSAKRAHVGVTDTVKQREECSGEPASEELLKVHAAGLPFAAGTRADYEIMCAGNNRPDDLLHKLRAITSISIEKNDDVTIGRNRPNAGGAGSSVAAVRLTHNFRPGRSGPRGGVIGAAIIHDDHFTDYSRGQNRVNDVRYRLFLIERGNND